MLGWLEFVQAAVAVQPGAQDILGPHAIPMWSHAFYGEERSAAVLEYLESINAVRDLPMEEDERMKYVGRYRVDNDPQQELVVAKANRRLTLQPPRLLVLRPLPAALAPRWVRMRRQSAKAY